MITIVGDVLEGLAILIELHTNGGSVI